MPITKPPVIVKLAAPGNYDQGREQPISRITFHHIVGDAGSAIARFKNPTVFVSSNYIIGSDGQIYENVPENDTAWCDGSWDSNSRTISIEHAGGHPSVPYTAAMYEASARLVAYLIDKYGIRDFQRHRDVIDRSRYPGGTACSGGLDVQAIIDRANQLIQEANRPVPVETPKATPAGLKIEDIPNKKVVIAKDGGAALWDLGFSEWGKEKSLRHFDKNTVIEDVSAIATHPLGGRYYLTEYSFRRGVPSGINVVDCSDVAVAPLRPRAQFERLPNPMNVRTKGEVALWGLDFADFADAEANHKIAMLPMHKAFTAVGKATRADLPEKPVYFMSAESFGNADKTGIPVHNQGVNTVDLEPSPVEPAPAPVIEPPASDDGDTIPVKILPSNPEAWKTTFKKNSAGEYVATANAIIKDLEGVAGDGKLIKGMSVKVAGEFTGPDGIKYYRTVKSTNGWTEEVTDSQTGQKSFVKHLPNWKGIPTVSLEEDDSIFTYADDLIDDFKEIKGRVSAKQKAVMATANLHGKLDWLADRLKKGNK